MKTRGMILATEEAWGEAGIQLVPSPTPALPWLRQPRGPREPANESATDRGGPEQSAPGAARLGDVELRAAEKVHGAAAETLRERIRHLNSVARASQYSCTRLDDWSHELDAVRDLAADLEVAAAGLATLRERLVRARREAGNRRRRIASAAVRLPAIINAFETALADYHRLELGLVGDAMRARRAECELEARKHREQSEQAQQTRERLHAPAWHPGRWVRGRRGLHRDRERLQRRLDRIARRRPGRRRFVDSSELQRWLDTLVDATRHLSRERWLAETAETRQVFYELLNVHCLQAKMPADELAANALLRRGEETKLMRCDAAERYLREYFAHRGGFEHVHRTLLGEYRERASRQ